MDMLSVEAPIAAYPAADQDQAQFEADKRAVYKHPLFPLLALLFERCEQATQSSDAQSSDAFNHDIQAFVQHQERDRKPFLANEPEIDGLMIKAIQVLRIHLLELEKVQELCKDFCNRYITCLKGKMQSENLLRSDYGGQGGENNNNNHMHSGSDSGSPVQYQQQPVVVGAMDRLVEAPAPVVETSAVSAAAAAAAVHGSTPLGQIGVSVPPSETGSGGPLSSAPASPSSADECDSDGRKQKRGILPKHATAVMRSWLFQHLVHPYPTEDEKRHIAAQTSLTLLQVNNWFINARRRILQPMLDASAEPPKKRKGYSRRHLWPSPPLDPSGLLSSSDEEGDSYSSEEEAQ